MKVLVTGFGGQLGYDVVRLLEQQGVECRGVDVGDFDLTDGDAVKAWVTDYDPDVIVHCAAYTAVDKAESEPEVCARVNGVGTINIVRAALTVDAKVVYISTDYIFSGDGDQPYETDEPYNPRNVYGLSKVQGEMAVRSMMTRFFILRTSWAFGRNGKNFVRTMLRIGTEQPQVRVVCDQIGSPTYTRDLARVICELIPTEKYGIYHVRNEGYLSWADFAEKIMRKAGLPCRVIPVLTADFPMAARRPLNSRLSAQSLKNAGLHPMPSVDSALDRYLQELREEQILF